MWDLLIIQVLLTALACYVLIRLLRLLFRSLVFLLILLPLILFGAARALWHDGALDWLLLDQLEAHWVAAGSPRSVWEYAALQGTALINGVSTASVILLIAGLIGGLAVAVILRRRCRDTAIQRDD